jgi:ribosomal protein S18 acetylase RimI-like enzyme
MDSRMESAAEIHGSEAARLVELGEARAYAALVMGGEAQTSEQYGLAVHRVGSAYALVGTRFRESLILNRVIGLGVCEPAADGVLDALDDVYRRGAVDTYAAEVSPAGQPADLPQRLRSRGFIPFKYTTMLYRPVAPVASPPTAFRVRRVGQALAHVFAELTCTVFQFGEPFRTLLQATFRSDDWQHWMAFDDEQPVAAAMTHVQDGVAWIGWVGTLPDYRGRGAQSALTAAQLEGAGARNCRWVTLEAATGTRDRPGPSLRNYRRLGWTVAYDRLVYVRKFSKRT